MNTKSYTSYVNFDLCDVDANIALALPFFISNAEIEVTYQVNDLEDEQGIYGRDASIEEMNVIKLDKFEPSDTQSDMVLELISGYKKELKEMVMDCYENI